MKNTIEFQPSQIKIDAALQRKKKQKKYYCCPSPPLMQGPLKIWRILHLISFYEITT